MPKPTTLTVKAAKAGIPVTKEGTHRHKTDKKKTAAKLKKLGIAPADARACDLVFRTKIYDEPVEVENTLYYQRRIAAGDLVEVEPTVGKTRKEK